MRIVSRDYAGTEDVLVTAGMLEDPARDPYELARYLSSGLDCGAPMAGPDQGGSVQLQEDDGTCIARFVGGQRRLDRLRRVPPPPDTDAGHHPQTAGGTS